MKRMLLGFGGGVLLASLWPLLTLLISPLILIFTACIKPKYLTLSFAILTGCLWVVCHWWQASQAMLPLDQGRQQWQLTGEVGRVSSQEGRTEFDFFPQGPFKKLKVSCYKCPWPMEKGDRWALALKLKPFISFHNPNGFNYRAWMLVQGYQAQASVAISHSYNKKIASSGAGISKVINRLVSVMDFPVLRALILGDKQGLGANYKRLINGSGLSHLFVVSGLHVGIVAMAFTFLLLWLQRPLLRLFWPFSWHVALLGAMLLSMFYAQISGLHVPVIRACAMLFFAAILLLHKRHSQVIYYLLLAFILVVMLNPLAFMGVGSWLSFGIVAALVIGMSRSVVRSFIGQLFNAQWLAFIAGGVILLMFNMGVAPLGFFLNLILIPLVTMLILPVSILALLIALLGDLSILNFIESALHGLFDFLLLYKNILTWAPSIHNDNRYLVMLAMGMLLLPRVMGVRTLALTGLVVALSLPVKRPLSGAFSLMVLDVGQGSAAIIETNNHSILVDTGTRFLSGMTLVDYVVQPYMQSRNIQRLDILHISHDDKDHSGGASLLLNKSLQLVDQHHCEQVSWMWDGVLFERFKATGFNGGNNGSCLLKVEDGAGHKLLMTGDIEALAEKALLNGIDKDLTADVLLIAHHGSKTSSTKDFLNAVNPSLAIISAGALNYYGHPHASVVQRLIEKQVDVYTTASHGAILVDFEPRQVELSVSTYRPNFHLTKSR